MRDRFLTTVTALALAVAVVAAFGTGAGARTAPKPSAVHHGKAKVGVNPNSTAVKALYKQNNHDSGIAIVSQNFEAELDIYDNQGVDDFKLKKPASVTEVVVTGVYFNGSGPADSVNVTFYKNNGGVPGGTNASYTGLAYTDTGFGSFDIKVPTLKLKRGIHWVSVQANMDFAVGGEWGWETRTIKNRHAAMWRNPGDGFSTGCSRYGVLTTCVPAGEGPDFMFTIKGKYV